MMVKVVQLKALGQLELWKHDSDYKYKLIDFGNASDAYCCTIIGGVKWLHSNAGMMFVPSFDFLKNCV